MKTYKSKVDWWLMVIIFGVLFFPIIQGVIEKEYIVSIFSLLIVVLILLLFRSIKYKIDGNNLIIWKNKIDINSIKKIYKTKNPLSSPALSIDRIAIVYNKYDEVLISPKERMDFINQLLEINPNIEVKI